MGRPKKIENAEETMPRLFTEFCCEIVDGGFTILPSKLRFLRWMNQGGIEISRSTLFAYLSEFSDAIKKQMNDVLADTLSEGAALSRYDRTTIIFCLKNWCGWSDGKQEISATVTKSTEVTASSQLLKALLDDNSTRKGE